MKVAIVTQPLMANYGGILQNYALQRVLKELGHEPVTIDWQPRLAWKWYLRGIVRMLVKGTPYRRLYTKRSPLFDAFVKENINTIGPVWNYNKHLLRGCDAVIVGSDQVWRPLYNKKTLPDMFLSFAGDFSGKRIAYAASFGVDKWEVDIRTRASCAALAARFDVISVREPSGVNLCKEFLGVDATVMPDPVRLLDAGDYLALCKDVPVQKEAYIAAYILDENTAVAERLESVHNESGLPIKRFTIDRNASLSVPEWLAMLRDARIIVTDSFHGAVMGQLFGKQCVVIENSARGQERFNTLKTSLSHEEIRKQGKAFLRASLS